MINWTGKYFISLFNRNNNGITHKKLLTIILFLGLVIRGIFFFQIAPWDRNVLTEKILINDAYGYNYLAIHLQHGDFDGNTFRTPGYPFFLAIVYFIFGNKPFIAIIIQILLSLLNIFLTYKIALKLFNVKSLAYVSALLMAIDPHQALYCNHLVTETLFVLLFLTSIYFLFSYLKENNKSIRLVLSSLFLGFSVLVRPIGQYFFLVIIILFFIYYFQTFRFRTLFNSGLYLLVFLITIFPWQLRNYILYDRFALSTANGKVILLDCVVATAQNVTGKPAGVLRDEFIMETHSLGYDTVANPFIKNDIRMEVAISFIKHHKLAFIKRHLIGCINVFGGLASKDIYESLRLGTGNTMPTNMFSSESISAQVKQFLASKSRGELLLSYSILGYLVLVYFSFFIGLAGLWNEKKFFILLFLLMTIIYFSGLTGVIGLARYRVPIMPFIILGSAYGIKLIFDKFNHQKKYNTSFADERKD